MKKVLYTAAHSGFDLAEVPLGGAAAICQQLSLEWQKTRPFEFEVLNPLILGPEAPRQKELVRYSEMAYARFCFDFEKKITEFILKEDPTNSIVLSNDISEGPDFKRLAASGFSIYTLYHVDVVDYFSKIYLQSWVKPEQTTAFYRGLKAAHLHAWVPKVLQLVWEKQEASVLYSKGVIVPSQRMKEVLLRCYPDTDPAKIHVLPWGLWETPVPDKDVEEEKQKLLQDYPLSPKALTLLMLSRISPEKGQDRLLKALALWEKKPDYPAEGISVLLSGESAYMMGERFEKELRRLASSLKKTRVYFVGFASAARKKALFSLATLYVFPSRHESYGLTLMEAMNAGLPVITTPTHGAQDVFQPAFGRMITSNEDSLAPHLLMEELQDLYRSRDHLKGLGQQAKEWVQGQPFSLTAKRIAQILLRDKVE